MIRHATVTSANPSPHTTGEEPQDRTFKGDTRSAYFKTQNIPKEVV